MVINIAITAKIPGLWKQKAVIYPQRGNGLIDPKIKKAKVIQEKEGENKLKIDGYKRTFKCPDNEFLAGNTYNFIEREPGTLVPIKPEAVETNENGEVTGILEGYNQMEREWLKRTMEEAHRYEKKEEKSFLEKYGVYMGMILFAGLILMNQIYQQKRIGETMTEMRGIAANYKQSQQIMKDTVAMEKGYYQPNETAQEQDPPNTEGNAPP